MSITFNQWQSIVDYTTKQFPYSLREGQSPHKLSHFYKKSATCHLENGMKWRGSLRIWRGNWISESESTHTVLWWIPRQVLPLQMILRYDSDTLDKYFPPLQPGVNCEPTVTTHKYSTSYLSSNAPKFNPVASANLILGQFTPAKFVSAIFLQNLTSYDWHCLLYLGIREKWFCREWFCQLFLTWI